MKTETLRLAFRVEGGNWNAYVARQNTMKDSIFLGSIAVRPCDENKEIKNAFMDLMKATFTDVLKSIGVDCPIDFEMRAAPEHEKSGSA